MSDAWFKPKRYGIGVAPATWRGWAALLGILIVNAIGMALLDAIDAPKMWSVLLNIVVLGIILWMCIAKSEGEWRWRWGDKE
jgi:hypothetical protein